MLFKKNKDWCLRANLISSKFHFAGVAKPAFYMKGSGRLVNMKSDSHLRQNHFCSSVSKIDGFRHVDMEG
jgi:hypothetical protein|uniref:Uncharacterized protein n=1 Tax=uncultured bacterium Contigcl_1542 TaxID=1393651 RepID=W0FSQ6_9BACT|nr:hypothetical protein [uncultured bacterium Contigcl_1542]